MRSNWLFLSAAAMLLTCGVGCSSSQVVRGQAPADGVLADNYCEADCDCDECSRRDMRRARRAARRDARQAKQVLETYSGRGRIRMFLERRGQVFSTDFEIKQ